MRKESCSQEWMTKLSHSLQSGMTLQHWTETSLQGWLTSLREDSPAKTLALQERVRDWHESYYANNKDTIRAKKAEYQVAHREEIRARKAAYYAEHREHFHNGQPEYTR